MGEAKRIIGSILTILHQRTGYDFRGYRESTLKRRIARRLHASGCPTETTYLDYLLKHPEEDGKLLNDLTIRVTEFFREPEAWEVVATKVIPILCEDVERGREIKIWSAGCATGEEAYSLAVEFEEAKRSASILGTDLDEGSLAFAREGIYSEEKLKGPLAPIREKYFRRVERGYQIASAIRGSVQFQRVDLVGAECPGTFDLISCRNVLIYFSKELQERVLLKFHEALKPGGFLWLGKAESLWGRPQGLFECVDKGAKIFRRGNLC